MGQNATVSISDDTAAETDGEMAFTSTLSKPVSAAVSVRYTTRNKSPRAGSDYTETSGWIDFLGGETSKTISVPILDDDTDEKKEQFEVALTSFVNVAAGSPSVGTGTITDNDVTALTAEFRNVPASHQGRGSFTFRVDFNQDVNTKWVAMRDDVYTVTSGDITGTKRVDRRRDLWEITVEPEGTTR